MLALPDSNLASDVSVHLMYLLLSMIASELCVQLGVPSEHHVPRCTRRHYIDEPSDGGALSCRGVEASIDLQASVRGVAAKH